MSYKENSETIDGVFVEEKLKKLWNTEIELLESFSNVCKKHNLRWYAIGGTLLGAVRHKGFIPWDDDIDVAMPLEDYKILCDVALKEFQEPYFFQTFLSDQYASPWHAKLRKTTTTGCTAWEAENTAPDYNKGVFIDVFPLYSIPEENDGRDKTIKKIKRLKNIIGLRQYEYSVKNGRYKGSAVNRIIIRLVCCLTGSLSYNELCQKYLDYCERVGRNGHTKVGLLSFAPGNLRLVWDSDVFDNIVNLPFDGGFINAPENWNKYLLTQYGENYMTPIRGGQTHSGLIYDTDIPFSEHTS